MNQIDDYKVILKEMLSTKRYEHSLAVMEQSAYLADCWNADLTKAKLAGLLHDICKEIPSEKQLQYLTSHGIVMDKYWLARPGIWHGLTGAIYLEHELNIKDKEILDAVRYHVLGRENMPLLDMVVFIADYTSLDRDYPHSIKVRQMLSEGKDEAMFEILRNSMEEISAKSGILVPDAVKTYNYFAYMMEQKKNKHRDREFFRKERKEH